jgi:hypothetical protein
MCRLVLEESGLVRLPEVDLRHFGLRVYLEAHTQPILVRSCQKMGWFGPLTSVNYGQAPRTATVTLLHLNIDAGHGLSFPSRNEALKGEAGAS